MIRCSDLLLRVGESTLCLVLCIIGMALADSAIAASELIYTSTADAFICSGDLSALNFGGASTLYSPRAVGQQNDFTGNQIGRQLYKFILPGATDAGAISSAVLRLKVYDNFAGFPYSTAVYGLSDA